MESPPFLTAQSRGYGSSHARGRQMHEWMKRQRTARFTTQTEKAGTAFCAFAHPLPCPASGLRVTRHEVVVADLGDLEPLIAGAREGAQRFKELLEIGIAGSDLVLQLSRGLEACFHDR